MSLPQKLPLELMQTRWASELNPLLRNKLIQGVLIPNVSLKVGDTAINHLLQRQQIGYIITDINGPAIVYRSEPFNTLTLTLTSDAACVVSVWCF